METRAASLCSGFSFLVKLLDDGVGVVSLVVTVTMLRKCFSVCPPDSEL